MPNKNISRARFINNKLLGRKRDVEEKTCIEEDIREIRPLTMQLSTETTQDRQEVVEVCEDLYHLLKHEDIHLLKEFHRMYLDYSFTNNLPPQLKALDASQPWLLYWIGNSLRLMNPKWLSKNYQQGISEKLLNASVNGGPFCGGLGQLPHLICNYAAVTALALCDNYDDCWSKINVHGIYQWLLALKMPNGGFKTCLEVGECDTRGTYCALSVAAMLNILTPELCTGVEEFLIKCQTYEGGFGGCPQEDEAHGGYTYCAVASLAILGRLEVINVGSLMEWCSARQFNEERGFSGRSNKLVDGCYSYWVGGTAAILEAYGYGECIDKPMLRDYILKCCQTKERPGLRDKPGKSPDFYHTNYVMLGLSITEHNFKVQGSVNSIKCAPIKESAEIVPINPVFGLPSEDLEKFVRFYSH
ncbi:LAFE_0E09054g1_1 [Lachancea fermentati]|uniref:Protein farnesyltransferase subunit beta n=1 Tax=Lachancea fermentati TaxID=4955 RepID=A0A1G4MDR1_LACFM|nr:LAFE_0E09054g1_1 [Lachancea fermentati]